MPGESANSELIIPSEDAPTEGFDVVKYLVRDQVLTFEVNKQTKRSLSKLCLGKDRRPWQPGAPRFDVANSTSEAAATIADESIKYISLDWETLCLNSFFLFLYPACRLHLISPASRAPVKVTKRKDKEELVCYKYFQQDQMGKLFSNNAGTKWFLNDSKKINL